MTIPQARSPGAHAGAAVDHDNRRDGDHDIAIGFGSTHDAAMVQAAGSLAEGYDALLRKYNGQDGIGWEDYLNGLPISPPCAARLETTASSST
jgi:Glucodextranase, domain N